LSLCLLPGCVTLLHGQDLPRRTALYFISDCQHPLPVEKIIRKSPHNIEAQKLLFGEIVQKNDGNLFMLGDMVGKGYKSKYWQSVDLFLTTLHNAGTKVYGIPGNHEYYLRSGKGIANFQKRFPDLPLTGYCVRAGSMEVVLLNSNFKKLTASQKEIQQQWYKSVMDSLDQDASVRSVIVCIHHSPFSNSKVVGSSEEVQKAILPRFNSSVKTKLFISGHSHNLELFEATGGKHYLVIGGGGGIDQPLYTGKNEKYRDLVGQAVKPRFFYLVVQRSGAMLHVTVRGCTKELSPVSEIKLTL
jgi:UDP-2,3-diacylglucosamine pyrophosphatase LpxH